MENKKEYPIESKIKDKLSDYVNRVEILLNEIKDKGKEAELELERIKTSEGDIQNNNLLNHFIITNYISLIYQDLTKTIDRLVECYSNALEIKADLKLTEKEQEIIDNYVKQVMFMFHIDKGKVIPKQENLLEMMKTKAETLRHETFLKQYKEQLLNQK